MGDAADRTRFQEARDELHRLLAEPSLAEVPVVVLGNKIDIPVAASEDELRHNLQLYQHMTTGKAVKDASNARPVELFMVSVAKRMGYAEAFQWLSRFLKSSSRSIAAHVHNYWTQPPSLCAVSTPRCGRGRW